ncbi:MAG: TetR/AcrR family transcriptional regulator [Gammaproteobacteria bacterium]|nr:TetR/AcrR family transcriptional regulator [Gammaproteobacteria bacterium]
MKKAHVRKTALIMAKKDGLINLSRLDLCAAAGIPDGSFPHVMGCTFSEFLDELKTKVPDTTHHVVNKSRADPALRREQILNAAVVLARTQGYAQITRDAVAEQAGVSMGLISRYFGTMKQLKRDVMRAAVRQEIPEIIAQGLANADRHARKAPPELKERAVALIANS